MATSDSTTYGSTNRRQLSDGITRYDIVLALIPLVLVAGVVGAYVFSLPSAVLRAGAGLLGAALVADAMFRNPPVGGAE